MIKDGFLVFQGGGTLETADKSGKIKLTVELEVNQPLLELARTNLDMVSDVIAQNMQMWRENMMQGRGMGGGHGMMHGGSHE